MKLNVDHDRDALWIELDGRTAYQHEQLLAKLSVAEARVELMGNAPDELKREWPDSHRHHAPIGSDSRYHRSS